MEPLPLPRGGTQSPLLVRVLKRKGTCVCVYVCACGIGDKEERGLMQGEERLSHTWGTMVGLHS